MSLVAWLGTPFGLQILLLALMCGLLFYLVNAGDFGPPGALIFVFAASVSMGSVESFELVLQRTAATGAALAAYAAYGFGASYAGWAAMGAVAVLQGAHLHITMNRALQRTFGNLVGAVLVALLLAAEPSLWIVIVLVALLAFATEEIIGANYGLGQILVTPMALLMMYLAEPGIAGAVLDDGRPPLPGGAPSGAD
ncbi:MAG: FUSC family protein [Marinobacter sp.]